MPIRTIADIVETHARQTPDAVAMHFRDRATTYRELDLRARRVANGLAAEGLGPQARVAILDKNSDTFFEILFGAAKRNQVLVSVNWRLAPPEAAYIINDARSEILFVGPEYEALVESILPSIPTVKKIVALGGAHPRWESYEAWRSRQSDADATVFSADDDVAIQLYTSGTTGHPKGAQLTNYNFMGLLPSAVEQWGNWDASVVSLVAMPLFHIGGTGYALVGFYVGAKNVILREVIPSEILRLIAAHRVTQTFVVPAVILFLLQCPEIASTDLSSMKLVIYGASPIAVDLLRQALQTFPCGFAQVYGLTETTGAFTYLRPEEHDPANDRILRSCGKVLKGVEVRVVDGDGRPLPPGQVGEIIIRSVQNMKGYWNLPEETAKAIRDGWLHTGDAGYFDEEGYLYIHDRVKDMIISGGENIYPAEVESALFGHPAVADVAVIGVPDPKWGEAVKAIVVRKKGAEVTPEELIAFARERIAHYKAPKSVDFIDALPRNPSGKILKRELRQPYWEGRQSQVV
jgi:acyl-CoA synthetase (AMP-forming)/AMP-acid ligase II